MKLKPNRTNNFFKFKTLLFKNNSSARKISHG